MELLTDTQIAVALDWWAARLDYMYTLAVQDLSVFRKILHEHLVGRSADSLDVRNSLPEEIIAALKPIGIGGNARQRLKAHMCFPGGGVLVCDGIAPYTESSSVKRRRLSMPFDVFTRSSIDLLPVKILLPFSGTAVWEEAAWYCNTDYLDKQTQEIKQHNKVWAACLTATCAVADSVEGMQHCLKWEYRVRFGPRQGTLTQQVTPFEADQRETAQQKAVKHYRTKLYEQSKEYVLVPFDDPEYGLVSFTTFLANTFFAC
jgi:hypothetical protein